MRKLEPIRPGVWLPNSAGKVRAPVPARTPVTVRFRNGVEDPTRLAGDWDWSEADDYTIVEYKVTL